MTTKPTARVYLDLTHLGRHVTGIERVAIEQFERVTFADADVHPVRASGVAAMIFKQQVVLPLLAIVNPHAYFIFPGFPPSPLFSLCRERALFYVHDAFLITRPQDLSRKAQIYMAPQFKIALAWLKYFLTNSEKTRAEIIEFLCPDACVSLYRPAVANPFFLNDAGRADRAAQPLPLKIVALGTVEPRKNYGAALDILTHLRCGPAPDAELHIIGRPGWGAASERLQKTPGVIVHGYLAEEDAKRVMEAADIYLCTSHDEGLGLPLIEAQFAGLPVIAPDKPVFREALGTSGIFVDPADADGVVNAISDLISNPDWRRMQTRLAAENIGRWNCLAEDDKSRSLKMFMLTFLGNMKSNAERTKTP